MKSSFTLRWHHELTWHLVQLYHIINTTFSSVAKCEPFDRYTTLQSLYTALDHQLQDGLMGQQEFDRTRFIVRKLWDLKLQRYSTV